MAELTSDVTVTEKQVTLDATETSNGGFERTTLGSFLLKMKTYSYNVEELDQGEVTTVVELAHSLENVQLRRPAGKGGVSRFPAPNILWEL